MRRRRGVMTLVGLLVVAGCGASTGGGSDDAVVTLAKIAGWRDELSTNSAFAVLEVAYDEATARAMWEDNVGTDLPEREGDPLEPGIYGDLADVDLTESVVVLYSSGESGSCPAWVSEVRSPEAHEVAVTRAEDLRGGDGCTDDYNPFRVLIAVDRDDLPPQDALAQATGTIDDTPVLDLVIGTYPVTRAAEE